MAFTHALLTRPRPQLDELADGFEALGLEVVRMPAFRFVPARVPIAPDPDWVSARSHLVIFTSPRAVEYGLAALDRELLSDSTLAAIGPATARALETEGLSALQAPGPSFDSEALLAHLDGRVEPGSALIVAAPGGREALQRGLESAGWGVRMAAAYERVPVDPAPEQVRLLEEAGRVVSVWTSGNALGHLLGALTPGALAKLYGGAAIVVSGRLARLAQARGFAEVHVSPGPGNKDLLACYRGLVK
jgi:uroporphyrinogen-III synthase